MSICVWYICHNWFCLGLSYGKRFKFPQFWFQYKTLSMKQSLTTPFCVNMLSPKEVRNKAQKCQRHLWVHSFLAECPKVIILVLAYRAFFDDLGKSLGCSHSSSHTTNSSVSRNIFTTASPQNHLYLGEISWAPSFPALLFTALPLPLWLLLSLWLSFLIILLVFNIPCIHCACF